ncbi:hypothetical protein EBX31_13500, partial [bacterium]|nr:hypothetical protein [bacterium]
PFPTNAKMYLVSASRPDFALSLRTNGPGAQTNNNNFASAAVISLESWNKQFSDSICVAPNTLADSSWTNKGEFLHVRTIDLAPIFSEARAAQQKAIEQEDKNLEEITRALLAYIQATGTIPDPTIAATAAGSWVANVSAYSSLGNQAIQFSFPANSIGGRRFYLDLNLLPYVGAPPPAGWAALPAGPASGYLVSCSKSDNSFLEPSTINGGTALSPVALTFLRTWQKTPDPSGVIAANNTEIVAAAWANRGEFLHVKSIDLLSLFCRVELEDLRSPANANITNPGSSYTGPITINNNGVTLTLTADSSGKLNSVSIVSPPGKNLWSASGTPPESSTIPISITAGGGTGGNIALVFPAAPSYAAGLGALSQMPAQTVVFYVLKGGSINLSGTSFVVRQDVKYQFSNGTWRQVY